MAFRLILNKLTDATKSLLEMLKMHIILNFYKTENVRQSEFSSAALDTVSETIRASTARSPSLTRPRRTVSSASASVSAFKACRARLYRQSVHEVLIAIYEAVTERVLGRTYALQAY
jgi:hypothetical protein